MLLTGFLAGPAAFLLNLQISFTLVPWACAYDLQYALHLATLIFLLMAALGGFASWRIWRDAGRGWPDEAAGAVPRTRFMAVVGILISGMFFLTVLAQGITAMILGACQ